MTDDLAALLERPGPGPHRTAIEVDGVSVETLADIPPLRDRLLFVGLNPSPVSVEAGHYFQGRLGRAFWKRLIVAGLLPADVDIATADDALVAAGHGFTDLLKVPTPRDDASDAVLRAGVGPLWQKVAVWRPAAVVFVWKRAAEIVAGRPARGAVGPARRRRPVGSAVLPDARALRSGRAGRSGAELRPQPGCVPAPLSRAARDRISDRRR